MSKEGTKSTISVAIVLLGISFLSFWYYEQKDADAQVGDLNMRITKVETLQPELIKRLDLMDSKIDQLLREH